MLQNGTPAVTAPPASLSGGGFYAKYVNVAGIPILGSAGVEDAAFHSAYNIVVDMLQGNAALLPQLVANGAKIGIVDEGQMITSLPDYADLAGVGTGDGRSFSDTRGLGGVIGRPMSSVGEENLLNYPSDPYRGLESILVHEFAHGIMSLAVELIVQGKADIEAAFLNSKSVGLWGGTYAGSNMHEYWAEITQSYFDTNRENDDVHNYVDTRIELASYDPVGFALMQKYYGNASLGSSEAVVSNGDDLIVGISASEFISTFAGNDTVTAGYGRDTIYGNEGDDQIFGNQDDDEVYGNEGRDQLFGGQGNDGLYGGKDDDYVEGNFGDDRIFGNMGNDYLHGGRDQDYIHGGQGNDTIVGGLGNDTLAGGLGNDTFVFGAGHGSDVVEDYRFAEDRLDLQGQSFVVADSSGSALLTLSGGGTILLLGVDPGTFSLVA